MAWSMGGSVNTAAKNQPSAGGDETGAFKAGGKTGNTTYWSTETETYNGTTWADEANDMAIAKASTFGAGNDADGISITGDTSAGAVHDVEEWNGTAWSAGADCTVTVRLSAGGGTGANSAIQITGWNTASCNEYNGTSWSAAGSTSGVENRHGAAGDVGDAIMFGGDPDSVIEIVESWNGTSWSTEADQSESRARQTSMGSTSIDVGSWGGGNASVGEHTTMGEIFNGTSWSTSEDNLNYERNDMGNGPCGPGSNNGISISGEIVAGGFTDTVEELTFVPPSMTGFTGATGLTGYAFS